jgi:hypothetical protein
MLDQDDIPGGRNTNLSLVDATANAGGIVSRFGKQHHLHLGYSWPSISSCLHTYDNSDETQHFSRKWIVESLNKDRHINIQRHVQHSATAVFA